VVELLALGALPGAGRPEEAASALLPYERALREAAADERGAVLVAELDGAVIGVCQLIVFRHLQAGGGLCAEIESVHVHPDRRGCGVGSELVRDAVERARQLGCYRVQLTSNLRRPEAHRFYERLGFTPTHVGFKLSLRE
jgi:GNAT superfamily N-acetyltransferase